MSEDWTDDGALTKEDVDALTNTDADVAKMTTKLEQTSLPAHDNVDEDDADTKLISRAVGLQETAEEVKVENTTDNPLVSVREFSELGLHPDLLQGVFGMGFNKPSRIQGLAIPAILNNPYAILSLALLSNHNFSTFAVSPLVDPDCPRMVHRLTLSPTNFIGQAQSGTGKTAAFSLSMIQRALEAGHSGVLGLCVAPTRELVRQIYDVVTKLAKFTKVSVRLVIPDESKNASGKAKFKAKAKKDSAAPITENLVIGTPGKIATMLQSSKINVNGLRVFVLDEADEMLRQQGLQNQTLRIKQRVPPNCQVLLFSATYDQEVAAFADRVVGAHKVKIEIPPEKLTLDKLLQFYVKCTSVEQKFQVLDEVYAYMNVGQSIIFVHTRETAKRLTMWMREKGHEVSLLHGADMDVKERDRVIDQFRAGVARVLITTNVLARGVDVLQVTLVINFDVPMDAMGRPDPETYLHRIGRSARYGNSGVAINFVHDEASMRNLMHISNHFHKPIEQLPVEELARVGELLANIG